MRPAVQDPSPHELTRRPCHSLCLASSSPHLPPGAPYGYRQPADIWTRLPDRCAAYRASLHAGFDSYIYNFEYLLAKLGILEFRLSPVAESFVLRKSGPHHPFWPVHFLPDGLHCLFPNNDEQGPRPAAKTHSLHEIPLWHHLRISSPHADAPSLVRPLS